MMNTARQELLRQKRSDKLKKLREKQKQKQNQRPVIKPPIIDESKWNTFYVLLKKEIEKNKYASHFILLLNDINTVYSSSGYKFHLIKKFNENMFVSHEIKDEFLNCFSKTQKKYNSLVRLQHIYRFYKAPIRNDVDMLLSPIDSTMRNIIIVFQSNSKYLFRIYEMSKIIKSALCNHDEFDTALPIPCKNPYNNIPFTKAQLINIYNQMLYSTQQIDPLVTYYYNSGFSLNLFHKNCYSNMNQQYIKDKYNSLYTKKQVVQQVKEMLHYISDITNGDIQFPKNEDVYMDLKPYLQLYYVSEYCSDEFVKQRTLQELKHRMKSILTGNPLYGRRIRKPNNLFTSNNINDIHKQIANLKGKPLSKKYAKGHTINTERTTFHYYNTLDGFTTSHENNRFVYLEEYPYQNEIVYSDHRHTMFQDDEAEFQDHAIATINQQNQHLSTSFDAIVGRMFQFTARGHAQDVIEHLTNEADPLPHTHMQSNEIIIEEYSDIHGVPDLTALLRRPPANQTLHRNVIEEGEIVDGNTRESEEEKDNT